MAYGGDALGHAGGQAIFVAGGIAGETVRAQIVEQHRQFARARLVEVLAPAPDRVAPRCPHFGFDAAACGGCQWQHIAYAAQLRFKTHIVREQLQRIGRIADPPVRDALPSLDVWAYRNHARFSVTPGGRPGFQAARSHRVIPVDVCHIVQPPILDWLRANQPVGESASQRISVRAASFQPPTLAPQASAGVSNFHIKGVTFRVSAGSFFQVNTSLIETLIDQVITRLAPRQPETILDAYCGVGLLTRFIAPRAGRVIGIESSASASADARVNLAAFERVDLREGLVEAILPAIHDRVDAAVVDPPRAGCGPQVIRALIEKQIDRLVYVSCDPATLARDIRILIDHGYQLIEVQPVDMFPHTYHIESIALLLRVNHVIL
jgi:23S rRNA (uracil1939-C5)-methyltransferase